MAVIGHVEHSEKGDSPRIFAGAIIRIRAHKNGNVTVDSSRQFGIHAAPEDGAGTSIGVDSREVSLGQREPALLFRNIRDLACEEDKISFLTGPLTSSGKKTESERVMYI